MAAAVKRIKAGERINRNFRIIQNALGKNTKGLDRLILTHPDGANETLTDGVQIHKKLIVTNQNHA